jgi:hypothetical protein
VKNAARIRFHSKVEADPRVKLHNKRLIVEASNGIVSRGNCKAPERRSLWRPSPTAANK